MLDTDGDIWYHPHASHMASSCLDLMSACRTGSGILHTGPGCLAWLVHADYVLMQLVVCAVLDKNC